jgi:hypothetical protein
MAAVQHDPAASSYSLGMLLSLQGEWTPLHFAAWTGRTEAVEALMTAGADLAAKDVSGIVDDASGVCWLWPKSFGGIRRGGGVARSCPMHALFINGWGAESADGILIVDFCFGLVLWEGLTFDAASGLGCGDSDCLRCLDDRR